jgi:osmotically-inducible protein OsmY
MVRLLLVIVILTVAAGAAYLWAPREVTGANLGAATKSARGIFENANEGLENAWTTAKVKAALVLSKRVSALDVDVDSLANEVTLTGQVPSSEAKAAALRLAADTTGVERVVDHLSIDSDSSSGGSGEELARRLADLEIEVRVYEAMLGDDVIEAKDVRVLVEDGVVTLTGTVPSGIDERYAEAIAESVPGVGSVVSKLVVSSDQSPMM